MIKTEHAGKLFRLIVLLSISLTNIGHAQNGSSLIISELMADNITTLSDEDGDYPDWIEIQNLADEDTDLAGWYLSDDRDKVIVSKTNEKNLMTK